MFKNEEIDRIKQIRLLPNIEFRLNKLVGPSRVNCHVILSDDVPIRGIEEHFLSDWGLAAGLPGVDHARLDRGHLRHRCRFRAAALGGSGRDPASRLYDCDFNQALELEVSGPAKTIWDVSDLRELEGQPVATASHCFGCTAGAGSSCGGVLA